MSPGLLWSTWLCEMVTASAWTSAGIGNPIWPNGSTAMRAPAEEVNRKNDWPYHRMVKPLSCGHAIPGTARSAAERIPPTVSRFMFMLFPPSRGALAHRARPQRHVAPKWQERSFLPQRDRNAAQGLVLL